MSIPPSPLRWLALILTFVCTLALLLGVAPLSAQTGVVDLPPVTIPAGQHAILTIKALCIEYNTPFARTFPPIAGMGEQKYVTILRYALSKGYVDSDPYQVALALWRAQAGRWVNTYQRVRAEEIFNNASQAPPPPPPAGQSLLDVLTATHVQITYQNWMPLQDGLPDSTRPWLGTGEIVVRNTGATPLTLTLPQGILLDAPQNEQDMIVYFVQVRTQPTVTPAPSGTRAPLATPRPMPNTGFDAPDDPAYLVLVAGGLLFILGLAADLLRRYRAMPRKPPYTF